MSLTSTTASTLRNALRRRHTDTSSSIRTSGDSTRRPGVDDAYPSTPSSRAAAAMARTDVVEPTMEPTDDASRLALAALTDDDIAAINASMGTSYARDHSAAPLLAYVIGMKRTSGILRGPLTSLSVREVLACERFALPSHQRLWDERISSLAELLARRETVSPGW